MNLPVIAVWHVLLICGSFAGCVGALVWGLWTYGEERARRRWRGKVLRPDFTPQDFSPRL